MFTKALLTCFAVLLCSDFGSINARVVRRDVIDPPITYPTAGTVWNVNDRHNVTWDTSVIPPGFNSTGMIVLGFLDDADGDNEHLDLNNPLAQGFLLTAGRAEITVPSVTTRDTYIIVLFGDSGNASPKFTITNISISSPPSSTSFLATVPLTSVTAPSAASVTPSASGGDSSSASDGTISAAATSNPQAGPSSGSAVASTPAGTSSLVASSGTPTSTTPLAEESNGVKSNSGIHVASSGAVPWVSMIFSVLLIIGFAV
ncbi:hypothetical protein K439DRAFT_595864 [Ramaria rubella]|nr:hypothetical protein K439DRAFT_595864 [Ramaria rubella]